MKTLKVGMQGSLRAMLGASLLVAATALTGGCESGADNEPLEDLAGRSDEFRPFPKKRFFALNRQTEYLLIGNQYKGDSENNLFYVDPLEFNKSRDGSRPTVDAKDDDVMMKLSSTDYIATRKKAAAAGTMDDDVQEEVAILTWASTGAGKLSVIDAGGAIEATSFQTDDVDVDLRIGGSADGIYQYQLETADVDGDGYDEIAVVGSIEGRTAAEKLGRLWIIDDKNSGHALLAVIDLKGRLDNQRGYLGLDEVRLAAGNVDEDGALELVVAYALRADGVDAGGTGHVSYTVFDDSSADYATLRTSSTSKVVIGFSGGPSLFNMDMGDVDGDTRAEIVFLGVRRAGPYYQYRLAVVDDSLGSDGLAVYDADDAGDAYATLPTNIPRIPDLPAYLPICLFRVASVDADKRAEIITPWFLLDDLQQRDADNNLPVVKDHKGNDLAPLAHDFLDAASITVGDTNGDFRNDIVVLSKNSNIRTIGFEEVSTYDQRTGELLETHLEWRSVDSSIDSRSGSGTEIENSIIVCSNVDDDSVIVESAADNPDAAAVDVEEFHTVHYGDLNIIAVLSAPPVMPGIGQNLDGSGTSLSTISGGDVTTGAEASLRAGLLVGTEVEFSAGLFASTKVASLEAEVEATIEATVTGSVTKSITETITYNAGPHDHQIIFSAVAYDRYRYRVVSHIDDRQLGKDIVINIPQEPRTYSWTRDFYNDNNGEQVDIDESVLKNVPFDIDSYPTAAQKNQILTSSPAASPSTMTGVEFTVDLFSAVADIGEIGPQTVAQGETSSEIERELMEAGTVGGSVSLSIDASVKACGAAACVGASVGATAGVFSETTWSEGLAFSGAVGGIGAEHYNESQYSYGLFAYRQSLQDIDQKNYHDFIVLNYWVEK